MTYIDGIEFLDTNRPIDPDKNTRTWKHFANNNALSAIRLTGVYMITKAWIEMEKKSPDGIQRPANVDQL